jgi:hypothetical protein
MSLNRQLHIQFHKDQLEFKQLSQRILQELLRIEPQAGVLPVEQAIASRSLVQKLWDALPDETQTTQGKTHLPTTDFNQQVTLHLGWDLLAFSCTLQAAWYGWRQFHSLNTDTFNCCIYPPTLDWYIIRAGHNLYPMQYAGSQYILTGK